MSRELETWAAKVPAVTLGFWVIKIAATTLGETGGDPALAAAGYYQGIGSVRSIGMLPETQRYVANVMALRSRFGG